MMPVLGRYILVSWVGGWVMSIKIFRNTQVQVAVLTALWFFGVSMLTLA